VVDLILGRPTATTITLSVLCGSDVKAVVAYGTQKADLSARAEARSLKKGQPQDIILEKLEPDTRYHYQLIDAAANKPLVEGAFHTQRTPGSEFTFTVTADSHLDQNTDPALYQRTLANALADSPDFNIDLGDTFMTEKHENRENAAQQYLAQRFYFGQLCRSAPLFLVLGNHDGEDSRLLRDGADSLGVWANMMRKRYFPNPVPDSFYTGNATKDLFAGVLQDYYSWQWGDGLFIVLDPFWFTQRQRGPRDNWTRTLGAEQYQWLKHTLEASSAKFKFVFIHNLVGGADDQGRGGVEAAPFYEWGGRNADSTDGFKQNRPGWPAPIHQLLVQNRVNVVFHGHDHLYAQQDLDGIVYQEVPQPGDPRGNTRSAVDYGYKSGVILGSSGHLRVTISASKAIVDYVHTDRSVAHSYTIPSRGNQ
jgi:predicted phosphodiesterase